MAQRRWNCPGVMQQLTDYYVDCHALPRQQTAVTELVDRVVALDAVRSCRLAQTLIPELYRRSRCQSAKPEGMGRGKRRKRQRRRRR